MVWENRSLSGGPDRPPGAGLDKSLRGWVTQTGDGSLILQRSVFIRYSALVVALVGTVCLAFLSIPVLDPFASGSEAPDAVPLIAVLSVPFSWAINVLRRRTVLDEHGIVMQRLIFAERRPWESASALTLSIFEDDHNHPQRARICLVNGDYDDVIRLPGCVLGATRTLVQDRGEAAVEALQNYIDQRGWRAWANDPSRADPRLAVARTRHGADSMARKRRLVFCTPAWRRIKERLCNGGLFLICSGALCLAIGIQRLFFEATPAAGSDRVFAFASFFLAPALMAYPLYKIYGCFQRVVVDNRGIRAGRKVCSWPESRSSLFVAGDRIVVVQPGGRYFVLEGAGVAWGSFQRRQEQLVARCEAIWLWGVARGFTRETGRYVPVRNATMQEEREILERGIGLAVPHRDQAA